MNSKLEILSGTSKKTGKPYKCVRVTCGDFSMILQGVDKIHMMYLEQYLGIEDSKEDAI